MIVGEWADPDSVLRIRNLAVDVGATPVLMTAAEHDAAVAAVSHVPQLLSSLLAARLEELPESALALAGQGLRDTTRIAASDPRLWSAIIVGNAEPVAELLRAVRTDLDLLIEGIAPALLPSTPSERSFPEGADAIIPGAVGASHRRHESR